MHQTFFPSLEHPAYKMYDYNPRYTQAAFDPVLNKIYENDVQLYGESRSYNIKLDNEKNCTLIANHCSVDEAIVPQNAIKYTFVITQEENTNKLQLRIVNGDGSHFLVSNKAKTVVAAGYINFEDQKIIAIVNESGAYHLDIHALSPMEQNTYLASLHHALKHVNLPPEKLVLFKEKTSLATACL